MNKGSLRLMLDYGTVEWRLNGKLHREDGPAVEFANGDKYWYKNGICHREGGPAIEYYGGTKCWYIDGNLHREDGPAVELFNGIHEYWYMGRQIDEEYFMTDEFKIQILMEE